MTTKSRDVRSTATLLIPASYTVQEVFGFPSQLPLAGYAAGHPLVPKSTPGYVWDAKIVKDFIEWLTEPNPDPLWIAGPTGCCKTDALKNVFAALNMPTVIVSAKSSTEPDDILGRVQLRNGNTIFVPGNLLQAYELGYFLTLVQHFDKRADEAPVRFGL